MSSAMRSKPRAYLCIEEGGGGMGGEVRRGEEKGSVFRLNTIVDCRPVT